MLNGRLLSTGQGRHLAVLALSGLGIGLGLAWLLVRRLDAVRLLATLAERGSIFTTIFLGIFIEAVPFLILGTIASGLVEVFTDRDSLARWIPRHAVAATLAGSLLGLAFPVCECGVIPLSRRLFRKGLPLSAGVAFLLAAPVVNPIVVVSTIAAFGVGPLVFARLGLTLAVAFLVGLVFSASRPQTALLPGSLAASVAAGGESGPAGRRGRIRRALAIAGDETFELGRYLVAGSILAAAMQTLIPQSALTEISTAPLGSTLVMMGLAFVLSICSTVDSFVALAFVNSFLPGSVLAFLVFGPMVDIKSLTMLSAVFRRRAVAYLVLLPGAMILTAALAANLFLAG
jgi:hypothetical protein